MKISGKFILKVAGTLTVISLVVAALDHFHDVDTVGVHAQLGGGLGVGHGKVADAQIGTPGHIAVFQQLLRHLDGVIYRDGKAQTLRVAGNAARASPRTMTCSHCPAQN